MSKVLPLSRWDKSEQFAREEFSDPELDEEEEEAYAFDEAASPRRPGGRSQYGSYFFQKILLN